MQNLLSSGRPSEGDRAAACRQLLDGAATPEEASSAAAEMPVSPMQQRILREIQVELRANGIAAEPHEIMQAMIKALMTRPALCRGLLAAYLVEG
jgi:hypothetical protein